jgi:hypothetical protein
MAWCPVLCTTTVKLLVVPSRRDVAFFDTETVRLGLPRRYAFAESRRDAPEITSDEADMMIAVLGQNQVVSLGEGNGIGDGEIRAKTDRAACGYGCTSMSLPARALFGRRSICGKPVAAAVWC